MVSAGPESLWARLPRTKQGYVDAREENSTLETFDVGSEGVSGSLSLTRNGALFRSAVDGAFDLSTTVSDLAPRDTDFSRFIRKFFENQPPPASGEGEPDRYEDVDPEELVSAVRRYTDVPIVFRFQRESVETVWANSLGWMRCRRQRLVVVRMTTSILSKGGTVVVRRFVRGPTGDSLRQVAEDVMRTAEKLKEARRIPSGSFDVVLDPALAAVVAHELFGHSAEMDGGSGSGDGFGARVAHEAVTVEDRPDVRDSAGWLPFDDEGVSSARIMLIENGVKKEGLHSLMSAFRFSRAPNGRARSSSFRSPPRSRMTNICLRAGVEDPQALIEGVRDGFYLLGSLGGISVGASFQVNCQYGYRIRNGKVLYPVTGTAIGGSMRVLSFNIRKVAKDMMWIDDGGCLTEEQFLLASGRAAPHILLAGVDLG